MTSRARLSVVIPTFDGAATLPATLASLRRQTRRPDEILVVDDGSRDPRSRALLGRLPKWVTLVSQENQGPGPARNLGIARSSGDLVLPLDDDDQLRPDALLLLEQALHAAPEASFAYGHVRYFGAERGTAVVPRFNGYLELFDNRLLNCALFRRSVFAALALRYPAGALEDWGLWLSCARLGLEGAVVEAPLFFYRRKESAGRRHSTLGQWPLLVAQLRAGHPALFSADGLARLKQRYAPSLEVLCTRPAAEAVDAARALAEAQGLADVRAGRAPGTGRALLYVAQGKYLLATAPSVARALAQRGPLLARAIATLEQHPEAAWAALAGAPATLLRTARLGGLIAGDLPSGAPPEALTEAALRLLPGLALDDLGAVVPDDSPVTESVTNTASASARLRAAAEQVDRTARALWRRGRGAAEQLLGEARVGRALHPLKLRADELGPSVRGAARALAERRLPHGLGRLVPPSVREERAMLDRLPPGAPAHLPDPC